ncbi:hypothetical protein LCGC14_0445860 [marine sediment metagenome]|uniref:Uncharacterized protein n=1 Tax=marine sediment metagenome TaxID=412755 RepID=A0A0F9SPS2_9ZZZZ
MTTLLRELRVGLECVQLKLSPVYYGTGIPRGDGAPVVLIPGALASDCATLEMRLWLGRMGYRAYKSGVGRMIDCPDIMRDKLLETIDRAYQDTGHSVTLIGHSLGGLIARGAALKRPTKVASVIMLASPFRRLDAHPLVMKLIGLVHGRKLQRHLRRTENSCTRCFKSAMAKSIHPVDTACIYTKTDSVVDWQDCVMDDESLNYEVIGTHIGLVVNRQVYRVIAGLLARTAR